MSFTARLTLAMLLLVALTASAVGYLSYRNVEATILPAALTRLDARARLDAADLNSHVRNARQDLLASTGLAAIEEFTRSSRNRGVDPTDGTPLELWRKRLQNIFTAQLAAKPDYYQFRFIGAPDGRELIRVDRSGPNGAIRAVLENELQTKGDRDYYVKAAALPPGSIYVSRVELNQENGVIATPHVPVIRLATPVMDDAGKLFGILVINIDMRLALDELMQSALTRGQTYAPAAATRRGQIYVVDSDGYYLLHPDQSREFGRDLGRPYRLQDDFPVLRSAVAAGQLEAREAKDASGNDFAVAMAPIRLAGGPLVTVVEAQSMAAALASAGEVGRATLLAGLGSALVAALLALVLTRSLSHPLRQMTASLANFTGEEDIDVPTKAAGEIGTLARAFARMAAAVREKTSALQREIEARRRVEERERLLAAAVDSANDAVITTTVDGTISAWNKAAERLFGYAANEAIGGNISMLSPVAQHDAQQEILTRVCGGENIVDFDVSRRTKDGSVVNISLSMSPIRAPDGTVEGVSKIARDITQRKLADERFRLAVEASPGAMIMADQKGVIQLVNAEAERMFGYGRDELIGRPIEILIPKSRRVQHERDRKDFAVSPARRQMGSGRDLSGLRKDGSEFSVEIGLNPIVTRSGPMTMASVIDISERKRQEELLNERARELERSNAELEQFAYVASHDLQEPLRMVASYTELLGERYQGKLDDKADKYIGYAVDGAKRMQRLVNDLLAFSRIGRRNESPKPADMNRVLDEALKNLRRAVEDSHAKIEIVPLPVVVADEGQMAQVFQNLIGNAIKFRGQKPVVVRIGARPSGGGWVFTVEDNGIGIEEQYTDRIFQMFQRLHDRQTYEGNGIGLTIAKKIVERHGGRIWFESKPGHGTTFFFTLPQLQEKAA